MLDLQFKPRFLCAFYMFGSVRFRFGKQNFGWLVLFGSGITVKHCFGRSLLCKGNGFKFSEYQFIFSFFPETWIDGATNRKFYFTITLKSFEEANDFCVNEGAILFEPKAEDINKRVSDHANTIQGQSWQTGLFEIEFEIEICKLDFLGRCFWISEIWEILLVQAVFIKCIICKHLIWIIMNFRGHFQAIESNKP